MNILFAGTPQLAAPALRELAEQFSVVGVLTAPDRASGRGRKVTPPPVRTTAEELGLPVLQPPRLDEDARAAVRNLGPDMLVSFAYGKIFGPKFMGLFEEGGINVHPSLLPKYRGPSPIPAVILAGEEETGITVQYISQKMDAGAIVTQERIGLSAGETTHTLTGRVAARAGTILVDALRRIEAGTAQPVAQDEEEATYCKLIRKEDGRIDWELPAGRIERMVRAYVPWPGAYTYWDGRKLTIWEAVAEPEGKTQHEGAAADRADPAAGSSRSVASDLDADPEEPGRVLAVDTGRGILIQTGSGVLAVRRLQLQAGKAVDWKSFVNGHADVTEAVLGG